VEFTEIDPEDKWIFLDYAFDEWFKKEKDDNQKGGESKWLTSLSRILHNKFYYSL
jgi:hypothetical protein